MHLARPSRPVINVRIINMLRSFFISLARSAWAQRTLPGWRITKKLASRFIAGESLDEAIQVIRQLNERGIQASIDYLGENTTTLDAASLAVEEIIQILEKINLSGVRANISIKLSQIGLNLDADFCQKNLTEILTKASQWGNFIRIDMEDSSLTEKTVGAYIGARQLKMDNCGIVIQSYLYRSQADIQRMLAFNGKVRLCKGAYQEPPEIAFRKKREVDENYEQLADLLMNGAIKAGAPRLSADGRTPPLPAFATHDERLIRKICTSAANLNLPQDAVEFQMLYGIRRDLQDRLASGGYPVRVYVPYGTHWFPYFMRRLGERPANVWFFLANFFRR